MKRVAWLGLFALVACTHHSETLRGVSLGDEVEAPGPSARAYSTRASDGDVVGATRVEEVRRGVARAASAAQVTLAGDGRLALLAGWLGERIGDGARLPPAEVTRFFALHLGLPEVTPHVLLVGVPEASATEAAVADGVGQYLRRQRYDAYGAAVTERQGLAVVVIVLSARDFTLEDVPRHLDAAGPLRVRGRLGDGLEQPVLEVRHPDGATERFPAGRGPELDVSLPLPTTGEHEVRLFATAASGSTVLARFPVYVGVEPPRSIRLGASEPAPSGESAASAEPELLRRLNETRAGEGLPPLVAHEGLAAVARAHSQDMVDHGFFAHQSPTTGSPADRARAAGLASGLLLENLGRGSDSASIHAGLLASPQHRANVLNRDVTHVGIGVVERNEGGRRELVVTEMFFRIAQAIDTATAPATLVGAINRARDARHAPPAELDANLSQAAQQAADRYLADAATTQDGVLDEATASLRRFAIAYRRVGGVMAIVTTLDEAATLEPTFDPDVRFLGVGVAQGTRPDLPQNSIVVVYLLGWGRPSGQ